MRTRFSISLIAMILVTFASGCGDRPAPAKEPGTTAAPKAEAEDVDDEQDREDDERRRDRLQDPMPAP